MTSLRLRHNLLIRWTQRSLKSYISLACTLSLRTSWAIAALLGSNINLFLAAPGTAGGLGGAWSEWLPSRVTTQTACLSRTRQFLLAQRFVRVASDGTLTYGDVNSKLNISVFMICSELGDRVLVLVSSRDVSQAELQRIRTNITNSFRAQP
ncbi:hypothetical protein H6F90_17480 [Trichocoleus sp. FACHB-591]|uniref:hypothetical protein n=1 Tax=Trichocoleus sp. FACHB-591 TaxID=2692872 RepID=UPI0016824BF1|nr:hypothetical protein [Trichocoleus sp. FACHB-591]MBD2096896.1 hypothetical protein [Trichocoleus sp. FACHB-591]